MVVKGKVDDWRVQRDCAWSIVSAWVKDMPTKCEFIPLIFDDEIREAEKKKQTEDVAEWYKLASGELQNVIWKK